MVILALVALGLASAWLAGGRLAALADLRLRCAPVLAGALLVQVAALNLPLPRGLSAGVHLATYAAGAVFLAANLAVPGVWLVATGAVANAVAIASNRGVMPASSDALSRAGLAGGGDGFVNSNWLPGARLEWLGDVLAIPAGWPFSNVYSAGDVLIAFGVLVAFHGVTGSRLARGRRPGRGSPYRGLAGNRDLLAVWVADKASSVGD